MRYRYRRSMLLLQSFIVVLVAGLGYHQLALLRVHDSQAQEALAERARLDAAYHAVLALDRERAAILHNRGEAFSRHAREFVKAFEGSRASSNRTQARALAQIIQAHEQFARQVATALANQPAGRSEVLRLDREAAVILRLVQRFRETNAESASLGMMHRELIRSAIATMAIVSLITLMLLVATFALLNRLSRSWAAAEAMAAADRVRTDFVSFISHELRNYLAALHDGVYLLLDERVQADTRRQVFHAIEGTVARLSSLVANLLAAGRAGRGRLEPKLQHVRASGAVAAAADRIRAYDEGLAGRLRVRVPEELSVVADPDYLDLVVSNLIDNARKFSPENAPIEVTVSAGGGRVRLSVRDYGQGIARERTEKIFRPYESASEGSHSKAGAGVGLYLCKSLIEAQGGSIAVDSSPGQGSIFTVDLPGVAQNQKHGQYGKQALLSDREEVVWPLH